MTSVELKGHLTGVLFSKTAQNHQQPEQSFSVELISPHQQGCHFAAAPTSAGTDETDHLC